MRKPPLFCLLLAGVPLALSVPAAQAAAPFNVDALSATGVYSEAWTINSAGTVGGISDNGGTLAGTIWPKLQQAMSVGPQGSNASWVYGINKAGLAVGARQTIDGTLAAYASYRGQNVDLPSLRSTPVYQNDYADEVNDSGQAVGYSIDDSGVPRAVTWVNGSVVDLTPDAATNTAGAFGINNNGVITGNRNGSAVEWVGGTMTELNLPRPADVPADANLFSDGRSINDNGDVVGYVAWNTESEAGYRAFIWSSGMTTYLKPFDVGWSECIAYGVNIKREVVGGCSSRTQPTTRPFIWSNGVMKDPGLLPGDTSGFAQAINDKSYVVGYSTGGGGGTRAVRWR
ncbi:MAG: hypothetical protein QOE23_1427 [Pseudonocardiales bacterium]|jgi:probable HAF family extracellular repeat protein|nr:hypothetical protein [Pseudonocardiales bacterium]